MTDFVTYTKEENEKIRKALEFYAGEHNTAIRTSHKERILPGFSYLYEMYNGAEFWIEDGSEARKALEVIK